MLRLRRSLWRVGLGALTFLGLALPPVAFGFYIVGWLIGRIDLALGAGLVALGLTGFYFVKKFGSLIKHSTVLVANRFGIAAFTDHGLKRYRWRVVASVEARTLFRGRGGGFLCVFVLGEAPDLGKVNFRINDRFTEKDAAEMQGEFYRYTKARHLDAVRFPDLQTSKNTFPKWLAYLVGISVFAALTFLWLR